MVLKEHFFRIKNCHQTATGFDYVIELNREHFIYQAHFPENPITPGVCIIQIIKELTIEVLQRKLFLKRVDNVKFLNVINPLESSEIAFSISISTIDNHSHKVGSVVYHNEQRFAKLSMLFTDQSF
jgi:3-hydroxyacyl-[acyl-carrier-protein] dehydratase